MTWAVGHLVQLAEPDEYDAKYKKWRMADLPIVPDKFKLVVRDERSKKQMTVVSKQLKRADVATVVNACDAGREGELIFAYLFEKAGAKKPVAAAVAVVDDEGRDAARLHRAAPRRGVRQARGRRPLALGVRLDRRHERHPRGDDPPALLLRRRRLAGPRADADAGDHHAPRGGDPRVRARALLARRRALRGARGAQVRGPLPRRCQAAHQDRRRGRRRRRRRPRPDRRDHPARAQEAHREGAAALRPHVAAARGQQPLRLHRPPHARRRPALLRGAQGAHVSAYELALSDERHDRRAQADRRPRRRRLARLPGRRGLRPGPRPAAAGARRRRRQGRRPPRDHPDELDAQPRQAVRRRPPHLRPRRAPLPRRLPSRGRLREHEGRDDGRLARLPHPRQGPARPGLARRLRRARRVQQRDRRRRGPRPAAAQARARRDGARRATSARPRRRPSRRGATPTRRCWARWRRPAGSSTTTRCARR